MIRIIILIVFNLASFLIFGQKVMERQTVTSKPFVLGVIEEINSSVLSEKRIINIYLPNGYKDEDTVKYPVIYLFDGSADEDFIHIVGLVQFNNFDWINQIPKSIVVGIASVNRERDFTFPTNDKSQKVRFPSSGHSKKFITFIEKELQPFMAMKYKANEDRTIIGQSLGGLLATEVLFKKPSLFNRYIIVSPSLWWDNASILEANLPNLFNTNIYIGVGKEGLTPKELTSSPRVMEVDANILADKIKTNENQELKIYFDYLPQENHATILHQAVSNAFRLLY